MRKLLFCVCGLILIFADPTHISRLPEVDCEWFDETGPTFICEVDAAGRSLGLEPLRNADAKDETAEIRVWAGGSNGTDGFVALSRDGDAYSVRGSEDVRTTLSEQRLRTIWATLECLGIWDLPDSDTLADPALVFDGIAYVVELRDGHNYRRYTYFNPYYQRWPEAHQLLTIMRVLDRSFDLSISDLDRNAPAWPIESGKAVYVRSGSEVGAFIVSNSGRTDDFRPFGQVRWIVRTESGEMVRGETQLENVWSELDFGVFRFRAFEFSWSYSSEDAGYLSVALDRPIELAQTDERDLSHPDFDSKKDYWIAPRFERATRCGPVRQDRRS
ncbi:MAG: hypothetical protein U0136_22240 [Bdellovibrionota bacterium]